MRTIPVVAVTVVLIGIVGACSSDDEDGPPVSDTPASIVEEVVGPADSPAPATDATTPDGSAPSTGLGSIDGPATVDPDFGGANPGGTDGGG
jgi:hypothetical protein